MKLDPALPAQARITNLRIREGAPARYLHVVFHPTLEDMATRAHAYHRRKGAPDVQLRAIGEVIDGAHGLFQPAQEGTAAYAGTIRLVYGHLTPFYVCHEATHAALQIVRMDRTVADFGDDASEREEELCYLIGDISEILLNFAREYEEAMTNAWQVEGEQPPLEAPGELGRAVQDRPRSLRPAL